MSIGKQIQVAFSQQADEIASLRPQVSLLKIRSSISSQTTIPGADLYTLDDSIKITYSIPKIMKSLNKRLRFNTLCLRSPSGILDRPLWDYFDLPLLYVFVFQKAKEFFNYFFCWSLISFEFRHRHNVITFVITEKGTPRCIVEKNNFQQRF